MHKACHGLKHANPVSHGFYAKSLLKSLLNVEMHMSLDFYHFQSYPGYYTGDL